MDYSRQNSIFKNEQFKDVVHVIGVGATGSWLVLALAKMGISNIHVWDFDKVEEHNVPNQAFSIEAIGKTKVDAMKELASENGVEITIHNEAVTKDTKLFGVVFLLTDTMSSRKEIWLNCIKNKPNVKLMIETRMGGDGGFIYTINPTSQPEQEEYEKTLYSDESAEKSLCGTSISVVATGLQIVSTALWQLINYSNKKELNQVISISSEYANIIAESWK